MEIFHYLCPQIFFTMFLFISTSEILFIIFISLMLFGSDKIPSIARSLGKGMRQLRDATDEIKNEINKSAEKQHIDSFVNEIETEVQKAKEEISNPLGSIKRN